MKNWPWFFVSIGVILVDQFSKMWAMMDLLPYQPKAVLPMVNLTLAFNTGAAFSFLHHSGQWHQWFFACFSFAMSVGISVWILRLQSNARLQLLAFSLILGGAIGNLIDRLRLGYVIDFIDVYYQTHHWPIFNFADSAIVLAALILLYDLWKNARH